MALNRKSQHMSRGHPESQTIYPVNYIEVFITKQRSQPWRPQTRLYLGFGSRPTKGAGRSTTSWIGSLLSSSLSVRSSRISPHATVYNRQTHSTRGRKKDTIARRITNVRTWTSVFLPEGICGKTAKCALLPTKDLSKPSNTKKVSLLVSVIPLSPPPNASRLVENL